MISILRRILILVLTMSLTTSSFAQAQSLKENIQDFQYFSTVEWDQKDLGAYDQRFNLLAHDLSVASQEDLRDLMIDLAEGDEAKVQELMGMASGKSLAQFSLDVANFKAQRGASWNGAVPAIAVVGVLAVVVYFYVAASKISY